MTDFSSICDILGSLYSNYREDKEFKDFIEFNDLGLPLAYLCKENLCEPSDDGVRYITETWELFLAGLKMKDEGFEDLEELFALAEERNNKPE
jgi:hypothetical protein